MIYLIKIIFTGVGILIPGIILYQIMSRAGSKLNISEHISKFFNHNLLQ